MSELTGVHEAVSEAGEILGRESEEVVEKLLSLLLRPEEGILLVALAGEVLSREQSGEVSG